MKVIGTFGCEPGTTLYGMPIGSPSQSPCPKSGWSGSPGPMAAMYWAECGSTGSVATGVFQTLSGGKISQPLAPGRGLAPAVPGLRATSPVTAKPVTPPLAINDAAT